MLQNRQWVDPVGSTRPFLYPEITALNDQSARDFLNDPTPGFEQLLTVNNTAQGIFQIENGQSGSL